MTVSPDVVILRPARDKSFQNVTGALLVVVFNDAALLASSHKFMPAIVVLVIAVGALANCSVPAETVVLPEYVCCVFRNVSVPLPDLTNESAPPPVPSLRVPAKTCGDAPA